MFALLRPAPARLLTCLALLSIASPALAQDRGGTLPEATSSTRSAEPAPPAHTPTAPAPSTPEATPAIPAPTPAPTAPAPSSPTAAARPAGRRAETPNGALSLAIPEGWVARSLKSAGVSLEPPKSPLDETIVAACEPFPLRDLSDEARLEDLLARLKAGQLATFEDTPRPRREKIAVPAGHALVMTYKGTDDGGRPSALRVAILPFEGRVAILTARLPWKRLEQRVPDLDALLASFAIVPASEEAQRRKRLVGTWSSTAVPGYALRFQSSGVFEETREKKVGQSGKQNVTRAGTFEVVGREVRLRFEEGEPRSFLLDQEQDGAFISAGQTWTRTGE